MITFEEEMQKLSPERRARIEAKTQNLARQVNMIRQVREGLGWSQEDLAECLGVQQSTISKLENADSQITLGKLASVVRALGGEWEITLKFPAIEPMKLTSSDDLPDRDNAREALKS